MQKKTVQKNKNREIIVPIFYAPLGAVLFEFLS